MMTAIAAVDTALWDIKKSSACSTNYSAALARQRDGVRPRQRQDSRRKRAGCRRVPELGYKAIRVQSGIVLDDVRRRRGALYYEPAEKGCSRASGAPSATWSRCRFSSNAYEKKSVPTSIFCTTFTTA